MLKTNKTQHIITIVLTCTIFVCACVLLFEFVRIANLKTTKNKLDSNLHAIQTQINEYSDKNAYYTDREAFLEEYARENYNWGKAGRDYFEV